MSAEIQKNKFSLTEGTILSKLLLVAVPIMGTQIVQMTYNLTDMFWLGRVGAGVVAASGTVGMYLWLSMAFMMFGRMGAEIGVSQNLGRGDREAARTYGQSAFTLSIVLGLLYGGLLMVFNNPLVGFFNIAEPEVAEAAKSYLIIISIGIPFSFLTGAITGMFNGSGNSATPFVINAVGLVINMVLDPLLIFNYNMGIEGAAIATVIAQGVACVLSVLALVFYKNRPFPKFTIFSIPGKDTLKQIFAWAAPVAIESFLFTFLTMIVSRFVAGWGTKAMATTRVASQVESLSWLIAGGFSSALTAFVGQNYGAGKWSRIHKGFSISKGIMSVWGVVVTLILYFGGGFVFSIFMPDEPEVIRMGIVYLRILSICQFVGCLEGIASGAFRGMGRTSPPSITSITCNALRVVGAYVLSNYTSLGLVGIWWAISIGAGVRGIWLFIWYTRTQRNLPRHDEPGQSPTPAEA